MDSNRRRLSASRRNWIDHRMGRIMKSYRSGPSSNFLALIQERKLLKEAEEEERGKKTLGLAEDCTSCIFLWLPIDDLQRSICVCKSWSSIIMDQAFIEEHLHQSDSGLLCLSSNDANAHSGQAKNTLSVESLVQKQNGSIFQQEPRGEFRRQIRLHFLEIEDGVSLAELKSFNIGCSGRVLGSCNGLVLIENKLKRGGLVVMNPATRKLTPLPAGTIVHPNKESYGFAYKSSTKEHVAVHLFEEESGYVSCEILRIEKRKWAMVNGPRSGLIIPLNYKPVFANGALHWLHDDYSILSMAVEEMKFMVIPLPKPRGLHDGIIELGGFLCFVTHELNQIDVWALKGGSEESWTKQHTVGSGVLPDMTPLSGSRYDRWVIFKSNWVHAVEDAFEDEDGFEDEEFEGGEGLDTSRGDAAGGQGEGGEVRSLFIYDFRLGVMNKVRTKHLPLAFSAYMPHVNSLLCG